jgi:purine-nucleoside phosphorylase
VSAGTGAGRSADPFEAAAASAARLAEITGVERHDIALVLGSGWTPAAEQLGEIVADVVVTELGGFAPSTVPGHASTVRSIRCADRRVLAFMGRVHLYEGHSPATVVHGVRTAVMAGCSTVVLTNAAGAVTEGFQVGQGVLIADHINLTGASPLSGPNRDDLGPRFVDMTDAWSARLRALAREVDPDLAEGVYAGFPGPQYETPAEVRMARTLGADLVGMSTVHECLAAVHLGAEVLGFSLVSNLAAGLSGQKLDHAEVVAAGRAAAERMGDLLAAVVRRL